MDTREIQIVGLEAIKAAVDHEAAYRAVRLAFEGIAAGSIEAPDELAFVLSNGGEMHIKGAHLQSSKWIVFKVASGGFPLGGNSGCSMVIDAETGEPAMILNDGGWLTEMRTAAAGAVAADLLAVPGPLSVAILGTGFQARFQLAALRARREVTDVRIWGRTPANAEALAAEVSARPFATVADAIDGADVVVTTTSARSPIVHGEHIKAGMHITAMGADMVGKNELAADVLDKATIIAADDIHTSSRVGELQHAPGHVARATSLAAFVDSGGGRQSASDVTVADLCGLGAFDAAMAGAVMASL